MFAGIVPRYDFLNHFLSLNLDRVWRRRAVRLSGVRPDDHVLDVCAGTGDLTLAFARKVPRGRVVATDFCTPMLARIRPKSRRLSLDRRIALGVADALHLPFPDASFDVVSVAFGIRNLENPAQGIGEMARVLRPGGRLVILEFAYPNGPGMRLLYGAYRRVIPWVARGVCGRRKSAYDYLNRSVRDFAGAFDLAAILEGLGFGDAKVARWTGGIVQLALGVKALGSVGPGERTRGTEPGAR